MVERTAKAEIHPVFHRARIVEPVSITDQATDNGAEVQQALPVTPVPSQPRGVSRKHQADLTLADRHDQLVEPWPLNPARGGPKVVVNDPDVDKSQFACVRNQAILQTLAFQVVANLLRGGLADVHTSRPLQVVRCQQIRLRHRPSPPAPPRRP